MIKILTYPDTFLRQVSKDIEIPVSDYDLALIESMKDTMYESKGIGLAAIQIGYQKRIAVVDASKSQSKPITLINPYVIKRSDITITGSEGCLSAPGKFMDVPRETWIKVEYVCEHGKKLCKTFYNMTAIVIQHELDHMDGKLCIDYRKDNTKDFLEEAEKEKKELNESYQESQRQTAERN
jgi:peptide deformylase|tara:strand:+ start:1635 stop:2177 length:543 start_codon:yes stop_codon:yes gene_type:complete